MEYAVTVFMTSGGCLLIAIIVGLIGWKMNAK